MLLKISTGSSLYGNDFKEEVENVLNSESLFIINYLGRFNLEMLTGFLVFKEIANYYLVFLDSRISFLAYSYIPHLEIRGLIKKQFLYNSL